MVTIIAHRGARSLAPENTLAAARKAHRLGVDLWEADVAVTADDQLILMHDDAMTRTTNVAKLFPERVPAAFSTYSLAEIRSLDAGSWFERDDSFGQVAAGAVDRQELAGYVGEKVPTLREAFELTLELDWFLKLADEVKIGPDHLLFSSARFEWLKTLRQRRPDFKVQAVVGLFPDDPMDFTDPFFDTFNPRHTRLSLDQMKQQIDLGLKLNPFTVNDDEMIADFLEIGVAGLITDFPQRVPR